MENNVTNTLLQITEEWKRFESWWNKNSPEIKYNAIIVYAIDEAPNNMPVSLVERLYVDGFYLVHNDSEESIWKDCSTLREIRLIRKAV